ncbi:MAG: DUF302 domain-containing protein [Solirubrobacteraceae bacterium]
MPTDAPSAQVPGDEPVTKLSPRPVQDTVNRLLATVAAKGLKVFAVIDHSGEANAHGLTLRDTKVVIFGSPEAGTPVMEAAPLAALDLPLKVLVWADGDQTKVSYTAPRTLAARYQLSDELAARLGGIDALTDAIVAP